MTGHPTQKQPKDHLYQNMQQEDDCWTWPLTLNHLCPSRVTTHSGQIKARLHHHAVSTENCFQISLSPADSQLQHRIWCSNSNAHIHRNNSLQVVMGDIIIHTVMMCIHCTTLQFWGPEKKALTPLHAGPKNRMKVITATWGDVDGRFLENMWAKIFLL